MHNVSKVIPQISVIFAFLTLWGSFAWGLPVEASSTEGDAEVTAAEDTLRCGNCGAENAAAAKYCTECGTKKGGEAEAAPKDPWARVRLSAAYDYAKCPQCGTKNEVRAERCSRCGNEFPQPSLEMTDPDMVFVPGKGYYREGTLIEPARTRKGLWITGVVLTVSGLTGLGFAGYYGGEIGGAIAAFPCLTAMAVGVPLFITGIVRTRPVYASMASERFGPYERPAFTLRSGDYGGVALQVEVAALGF